MLQKFCCLQSYFLTLSLATLNCNLSELFSCVIYLLFAVVGMAFSRFSYRDSVFECGYAASSGDLILVSMRFAFLLIVVTLLEVEVSLMVPWGVSEAVLYGLVGFLMLLLIGLFLELKSGVLKWN